MHSPLSSPLHRKDIRWLADSTTDICMGCSAKFSFTVRRHHCRVCGKIFCGRCSNNTINFHKTCRSGHRACNQCYRDFQTSIQEGTVPLLTPPWQQQARSASPQAADSPSAAELAASFVPPPLIPANQISYLESRAEKLGQGSFGTVTRALWKDRSVAIKNVHQPASEKGIQQLQRETALLIKLKQNDRNDIILTAYGYVENVGSVMEFMLYNLHQLIHEQTHPGLHIFYSLILQFGSALKFLRSQRVVHCDLKPLNILLNARYALKLCDFERSQILQEQQTYMRSKKYLTTVPYAAPEVFKKNYYSFESDLYSFGIICNELVSRNYPFIEVFPDCYDAQLSSNKSQAVFIKLSQHVQNGHRPPIPEHTPPLLAQIMQAAWASDPQARNAAYALIEQLKTRPAAAPIYTSTAAASASPFGYVSPDQYQWLFDD